MNMHRKHLYPLIVALALLLLTTTVAVVTGGHMPAHAANNFTVRGSQIIDPNGNVFVAKGTGVVGPGWVWPGHTTTDIDAITNTWKFNTIRIDTLWNQPLNNQDTIDQIVQAFTPRGVVVIINADQNNGTSDWLNNRQAYLNYISSLASTYKSNPYVWFDVQGENGDCSPVTSQWLQINQDFLGAIRGTGNNNIYIAEENSWGQGGGETDGQCWGGNNVGDTMSAALTYGQTLNSQYSNIVYSIHVYDQWNNNGVAKMTNYMGRVQAKGLALIIGEYGNGNNGFCCNQAVSNMFTALQSYTSIGRVVWHWYCASGAPNWEDCLTTVANGATGASVNSTTNPTNLSWLGQQAWNDSHSTAPTPTPVPGGSKYEAENAALSGGAKVNNNHANYSGTGFVDGYWNVGATTTFTVNIASSGTYQVDLRYGNNMGSTQTLNIYVNGTLAKTTHLANLANWDSWSDQTETLNLNGGNNTIAYKYDSSNSGNVNLDYINLTAPYTPKKYEAENATLAGGAAVNNNHPNYSGTGFVDGYWNVGATTTFSISVPSAGSYSLDLRYANNMGNSRTLNIYINGTLSQTVTLNNLANWDSWSDATVSVSLNAGSNTIAYKYDSSNSGNVNLDYITV